MDEKFRRSERLTRKIEFDRVFRFGAACANDDIVVHVVANDMQWSRLGIVTGKKVGNAVQRNYVRRRIRESFRRNKDRLPLGVDIVCVAKASAYQRLAVAEFSEVLIRLVVRAMARLR